MKSSDNNYTKCTRCLFDSTVPKIVFDKHGICSYCHLSDRLEHEYPISGEKIDSIVKQIKRNRRGDYDVVVGISGGCDSSYMLLKAVQWGLKPLAVHYDNTYNTAIASMNMRRLLEKLNVDLETYVVDATEMDNIYRAFIEAGTADLESTTDIALAATLYKACVKHDVSYIFEGHSFRTEGVFPTGWTYMDSRYIQSVYDTHGPNIPLKSFPHMWLSHQLYWMAWKRIKKIRPLVYLDYSKNNAKRELAKYGWKDYGSSHCENHMSAFFHQFYLPLGYGVMPEWSRDSARQRQGLGLLATYSPVRDYSDSIEYVKSRLGVSSFFWNKHTVDDYKNYKRTFKLLKPLFWLLAKNDLIPRTFYEKYCSSSYT